MNGSIRVSAKTVDDAITEALIQLGVTSDRLEYEVIEKGSAGFLGHHAAVRSFRGGMLCGRGRSGEKRGPAVFL